MTEPNYLARARKIIAPQNDGLLFLDANLAELRKFRWQCENAKAKLFSIYGTEWQLKIAAHYLRELQNIQFYEVDMKNLLGVIGHR